MTPPAAVPTVPDYNPHRRRSNPRLRGRCLRTSGDRYNRALQDLVNFTGRFLGFEVVFGQYQGIAAEIGFDGHWKSPTGFHIVVEAKTTDVYAIKTATLMDYIDQLIGERAIPAWDHALGLYVIGHPNPDVRQLENAIIAERHADQLRIVSVDHLLSLAEMMKPYAIPHPDILEVIRPSRPTIDPIVELMTRFVADRPPEPTFYQLPTTAPDHAVSETGPDLSPAIKLEPEGDSAVQHWLTPVATDQEQTAEQCIATLRRQGRYLRLRRAHPRSGSHQAGRPPLFYASGKGVVAHATVASSPERKLRPEVRHSDKYPWTFQLRDSKLYLEDPIVLDEQKRSELDAFANRDPARPWAWLVQATRRLTRHDFDLLTRR